MSRILDKIKEGEKISLNEKKPIYFYFNLDDDSYWFEGDNEIKTEPSSSFLDFYKGKNEFEEKTTGSIYFKIWPDGRRDFFLLYIYDSDKKIIYTIFSNPYGDIEVFKGESEYEPY